MSSADRRNDSVSVASIAFALSGFAVALFGVYWDDAWHTDRGRDELLSAPHLALYAGVAVAVAVVAWWGWGRRQHGWRAVGSGPIGIAIAGGAVTLGSAPVDEWWHSSFGRDAVLWSPPHLVALVGTVALGSGVLLVAGHSLPMRKTRSAAALLAAAGAGVVGGWMVLVLEYDTDVAQFSPFWYLPVMAVGLSAAALTVQAAAGDRLPWAAAWSGLAYTVAMIVVVAVLSVADFSTPLVPVVIVALAAADLGQRRNWPVLARSSGLVVVLFLTYVPYLEVVPGGVAPSISQAIVGAALGVVGVAATIVMFDPAARWRPPLQPVVTALALSLLLVGAGSPRPAAAHDPGQGDEFAEIELTAEVSGGQVELVATLESANADLTPIRIAARRAGRTLTGPLVGDDTRWSGRLDLDEDGRWFVYVEAIRGDDRLEAWLPVTAGDTETTSKQTLLYLIVDDDTSSVQVVAGVILTLLAFAIVVRIAASVRVARPSTISAVGARHEPDADTA